MITKEEILNELEEQLDKQFPKGNSKERGHALVLFAEFYLALDIIFDELNRLQEKK